MKNINKYFYIMIAIIVVVFTIAGIKGINQVSDRKEDYNSYLESKEIVQNSSDSKELKKSIDNLNSLEKKYGEVPYVLLEKSKAYLKMNEFDKSQEEMKKCLKSSDLVQKDPNILYFYGKVAYLNGDIKEAKYAMKKAKDLGILESDMSKQDKKFIENIIKE